MAEIEFGADIKEHGCDTLAQFLSKHKLSGNWVIMTSEKTIYCKGKDIPKEAEKFMDRYITYIGANNLFKNGEIFPVGMIEIDEAVIKTYEEETGEHFEGDC